VISIVLFKQAFSKHRDCKGLDVAVHSHVLSSTHSCPISQTVQDAPHPPLGQTQTESIHCFDPTHSEDVPHKQAPPEHVSAVVALQDTHCAAPVPHCSKDGSVQTFNTQHPLAQLLGVQVSGVTSSSHVTDDEKPASSVVDSVYE
jgi:hypothetical protein